MAIDMNALRAKALKKNEEDRKKYIIIEKFVFYLNQYMAYTVDRL